MCEWEPDDADDPENYLFITSCGKYAEFESGGPIENGLKFCPYCGLPINNDVTE